MRAPTSLLALVLLAPSAMAAGMAQPVWTAGDQWSYATPAGNATLQVAGPERAAAGTALANAWNLTMRVEGAPAVSTWQRQADLAQMKERVGDITYAFDAPCLQWQFPLETGKTWTTSCVLRGSDGSVTMRAANWTVAREEDVFVPAGGFHAFVLVARGADGNVTTSWWAPAACNVAKAQTRDANGSLLDERELASVRCAAAPDLPAPAPPASSTPAGATTPASGMPAETSPASSTPAVASPTPVSPRAPGAPWAVALLLIAGAALLRKRS